MLSHLSKPKQKPDEKASPDETGNAVRAACGTLGLTPGAARIFLFFHQKISILLLATHSTGRRRKVGRRAEPKNFLKGEWKKAAALSERADAKRNFHV